MPITTATRGGIFALTSATLVFEIALTRLFSVAQGYHYAFLAVSLALLGFGASGSLLYLPVLRKHQPDLRFACLASAAFAVACVGGYLAANYLPFDSYRLGWDSRQPLYLIVLCLALALPFLFSGLALGHLLSTLAREAEIVYSWNLAGSGAGCLAAVLALPVLAGAGTVVFASLLGIIAGWFFWLGVRSREERAEDRRCGWRLAGQSAPWFVAVAGLLVLGLWSPAALEVRMSPYKALSLTRRFPDARLLSTRWNAYSRVDVVESSSIRSAPGISLAYGKPFPPELGLTVDGDDLLPIVRWDGSDRQLEFTSFLPGALPYRLRPEARVLLVSPRGNLDLLTALGQGARQVQVVETNPLALEAVRVYGGKAFFDPRVQVQVEGPRSFLAGSGATYDLVVLALADSYRPVSSGAYSLLESYGYTVDAFLEYYRHLSPGGFLVATRWLQWPPSEELRAVATAIAMLDRVQGAEPVRSLAAYRTFSTFSLLVKRGELAPEEIASIREFCQERGFDLVYLPGLRPEESNLFNVYPRDEHYLGFGAILSAGRSGFLKRYQYELSPTVDTRPFFFHFFRLSQTPEVLARLGKTWQPFGGSGYLVLLALLAVLLVVTTVLILLPLALARGRLARARVGPGRGLRLVVYFLLLGAGYMFIEMPLLQQFILYLGQPVYAIAGVLFALLVASGLGSLVLGKKPGALMPVLLLLGLLAAALPQALSWLSPWLLGQGRVVRVVSSVGLLLPLGFIMGAPFPLGIKVTEALAPGWIPWAWAANGCASVVASVLATMANVTWGFTWTEVGAGLFYLLGLVAIYPLARTTWSTERDGKRAPRHSA